MERRPDRDEDETEAWQCPTCNGWQHRFTNPNEIYTLQARCDYQNGIITKERLEEILSEF